MTRIINLFGGPCTGKSTTAAELFAYMKKKGLEVELAQEYAKDMVFESRSNILGDQLYILAKQHRRISRLIGKVDWVVTDSPFILGLCYTTTGYYKQFEPLVLEIWDSYENTSYLLHRDNIEYNPNGRNQTTDQLAELDNSIKTMLHRANVAYKPIVTGEQTLWDICEDLGI